MSQKRSITSYFKQAPARQNESQRPTAQSVSDIDAVLGPSSSPLSSCQPVSSSAFHSPATVRRNSTAHDRLQAALKSDENEEPSFSTSSFGGSSQRVIRNGSLVVTNSDSDTDSISSTESPEALLARFSAPSPSRSGPAGSGRNMPLRGSSSSRTKKSAISTEPPKYKFSMSDLVMDAVDDNEMRANVTKARQALEHDKPAAGRSSGNGETSDGRTKAMHDEVLLSVVEDSSDTTAIQRLKDAVDRTEAFDRAKRWCFFENDQCPPSPLRFPGGSVPPGFWGGVLRDSSSRERAFFSGIVAESLASGGLPDELILWILHAVTVESRDDLRYAYCSSLKRVNPERLRRLISPSHVDQMFRRLGAKASALAVNEIVQPGYPGLSSNETRNHQCLLSLLDIVTGISNKLNYNTREHLLKVLLRLTLDETCMNESALCVETQNAIVSLLQESDDPLTDISLYEVSMGLYKTLQDVTLQNHLLKQLLPVTPRIALFRSRLALAFLHQDPSPLDKPKEHLVDLKRITSQLHDPRFDVSSRTSKQSSQRLDYFSFAALTSVLDAAIDSGTTADPTTITSDRNAEEEFNRDVDRLAHRIKVIFTSIQDSGASHLKRTEAKESLQAVHYRLVYGVRTKERPRKSWFSGEWSGKKKSKTLMENHVSLNNKKAVDDSETGAVEDR